MRYIMNVNLERMLVEPTPEQHRGTRLPINSVVTIEGDRSYWLEAESPLYSSKDRSYSENEA